MGILLHLRTKDDFTQRGGAGSFACGRLVANPFSKTPRFRNTVVAVWSHRCAFCGYAVQLDNTDLALEAAHIRWCQFGGPDTADNGLACCSIHHQAFDRGALTIANDLRILVSSRLHGSGRRNDFFLALHGTPLPAPSRRQAEPNREFLAWHRAEVFRGEARS